MLCLVFKKYAEGYKVNFNFIYNFKYYSFLKFGKNYRRKFEF